MIWKNGNICINEDKNNGKNHVNSSNPSIIYVYDRCISLISMQNNSWTNKTIKITQNSLPQCYMCP